MPDHRTHHGRSRGATAVEYALVLALLLLGAIAGAQGLDDNADEETDQAAERISRLCTDDDVTDCIPVPTTTSSDPDATTTTIWSPPPPPPPSSSSTTTPATTTTTPPATTTTTTTTTTTPPTTTAPENAELSVVADGQYRSRSTFYPVTYATVTSDGQPVAGATISVSVAYRDSGGRVTWSDDDSCTTGGGGQCSLAVDWAYNSETTHWSVTSLDSDPEWSGSVSSWTVERWD